MIPQNFEMVKMRNRATEAACHGRRSMAPIVPRFNNRLACYHIGHRYRFAADIGFYGACAEQIAVNNSRCERFSGL